MIYGWKRPDANFSDNNRRQLQAEHFETQPRSDIAILCYPGCSSNRLELAHCCTTTCRVVADGFGVIGGVRQWPTVGVMLQLRLLPDVSVCLVGAYDFWQCDTMVAALLLSHGSGFFVPERSIRGRFASQLPHDFIQQYPVEAMRAVAMLQETRP